MLLNPISTNQNIYRTNLFNTKNYNNTNEQKYTYTNNVNNNDLNTIASYNKIGVYFKGEKYQMPLEDVTKILAKLGLDEKKLTSKTMEECKQNIESFKHENPNEYKLIKNIKLVISDIHIVKDDKFKSPKNDLDEYITQTINLINNDGKKVGYYTLFFNKKGKAFEDVFNIF